MTAEHQRLAVNATKEIPLAQWGPYSIQGNLFVSDIKNSGRKLMDMIDNVNFSQRDDVLKFAASGTTRNWKMQQNFISDRYTTRWNELFEVH